jgi:pyruvate formate lyase activating enzyme
VEEVLAILEDDRIYFDESRGGVTFSGGEPFAQPDFLRDLLLGCRERELPVVLDTCGHVAPETFRELAPLAGGLLFDLKLMDGKRHEAFTGVHNRWILENLKWVGDGCEKWGAGGEAPDAPGASMGHPMGHPMGGRRDVAGQRGRAGFRRSCPDLTVRLPLIPDVNDDEENLLATAAFLCTLAKVPRLDILPYHRLGVEKYHRTGRAYPLSNMAPPPDGSVGEAVRLLEGAGLDVTVRGEPYGDD